MAGKKTGGSGLGGGGGAPAGRGGIIAGSGSLIKSIRRLFGGTSSSGIKVPNPFTSSTIGHETSSGQTAMFKPSDIMPSGMRARGVIGRGGGGRVTTNPPFRATGRVTNLNPGAQVRAAARQQELARIKAAKKSDASRGRPIAGPKPKEVQYVDDLFGVPNAPLGVSYAHLSKRSRR
jgi:hypothetical protein